MMEGKKIGNNATISLPYWVWKELHEGSDMENSVIDRKIVLYGIIAMYLNDNNKPKASRAVMQSIQALKLKKELKEVE
jgi:hypothetical protein